MTSGVHPPARSKNYLELVFLMKHLGRLSLLIGACPSRYTRRKTCRAEIERLRTENDERARETERVLAKLKDVAIENERLRDDLNGHKKLIVDLDAEINPLKAENERLRYEKGLMVAALEQIRGAHLPEAPKESYQRAVATADNVLRLVLGKP